MEGICKQFPRRKSIFAASIVRMASRGESKLRAAGKRAWHGLGFSAEASNHISLMKWESMVKPIGSEKKDIHVLFS